MDPQHQRQRQRFQIISVLCILVGWFVTSTLYSASHGNFLIYTFGGLAYFIGVALLLWALDRRIRGRDS